MSTQHLITIHQRELEQSEAQILRLQDRRQELRTILATLQVVQQEEIQRAAAPPTAPEPAAPNAT